MRTIRAEQVGSLLRPPDLLKARAAHAEGNLPLAALREMEDAAIRQIIERQRQTGIDILTDGELRRASWLTDMSEAVEGFVTAPITVEWKGPKGGRETSTARAVAAKLRKTRHLTDFELRAEVCNLMDALGTLRDGSVARIDVRHGIPRRLLIERSFREVGA